MAVPFRSSRDIILRTPRWPQASEFYQSVLGFTVASESKTIVGLETGSFRLYVEKGEPHGPVFDLPVPDVQAATKRLLAAGCIVQKRTRPCHVATCVTPMDWSLTWANPRAQSDYTPRSSPLSTGLPLDAARGDEGNMTPTNASVDSPRSARR